MIQFPKVHCNRSTNMPRAGGGISEPLLSLHPSVQIRVKSASGQVGLSQLGRVNSAGSSWPYIVVNWLIEKYVPNENTSL